MIGLLRLTMPHGEHLYVNPTMITFFCPNTKLSADAMGCDTTYCNEKGSLIYIAGVRIQVLENPNTIINSITRLRQKAENNALELRKKLDKEDWEDDDDDKDE